MCVLFCVAGVASAEQTDAPANEVYRIGVPDLLSVRVWEQAELTGTALVRTDGKISVPLIGDISAEGRTPEELADAIEAALAEFVSQPRVDIAVLEMRSQVVSVIGGGIERSGVLELRHEMRVLDAIAEMGGFTPFAKKRKIKVLRSSGDREVELNFDYPAFLDGKAPGSNFLLQPGDTIIVPE
ncbi:MAG: polysaccharide biosynthesis/export family protein [Pseudomonadales bacterium]